MLKHFNFTNFLIVVWFAFWIALALSVVPLTAKAALSDWNDDFESYSNGALATQGLWENTSDVDVTSFGCNSGSKCVHYDGAGASYSVSYKDTSYALDDLTGTTTLSYYVSSTGAQFFVGVATSSSPGVFASMTASSRYDYICGAGFKNGFAATLFGNILGSGAGSQSLGTGTSGTYYLFELALNFDTGTCGARFGGGSWKYVLMDGGFDFDVYDVTYLMINNHDVFANVAYIDDITISVSEDSTPSWEEGTNTRITAQNSPTIGLVSTSTTVLFDYDFFYNSVASTTYDFAGYELINQSAGFQYNITESAIVLTGASTFSTWKSGLTSGARHIWRPYLRNSTNGVYLYGDWYPFDVESIATDYSNYIDLNTGLPISTTTATSTVFYDFLGVGTLLTERIPFAYLFNIYTVFKDISNNNTGTSSLQGLYFSTGSSTPVQVGINIFTKQQFEDLGLSSVVSLFRSLIGASLWLALAYMFYRTIRRIV